MTKNVLPFRRVEQRDRSDEELVLACAANDERALEELFHRHCEQVQRVLVRLGQIDRKDLEDVVQSTFLEVFRSAKRFGGRSAVSTWILGIAMNVRRHLQRGESRRHAAMAAIARVTPAIDQRRPDEWASRREALDRLQRAFEALPQDFRVVFVLCDLEGLKGVDVARTLGLPEGTVWRRLHEARLRLRAQVQDQEGGR